MDNKKEELVELVPLKPGDIEYSKFDIGIPIILILVSTLPIWLPLAIILLLK
ncbi:hypothetical protein SAMN02745163_04473 [Clostridium cavendishii DSM 21758]|uniref:Uncharacterized protein n=1 Tax=Clostridium cavendishii DSM 21758 TaxID=1121302 RepID=A0A1M6VCV9_9CLOT|nr:hypothetical protein [Clostridium cavendishii]SHK79185.1 hypothetical protein SAMN02745163_04473 [Clostridium cavendishii DSM 21758]